MVEGQAERVTMQNTSTVMHLGERSLAVQWLRRASQEHEIYCVHDLKVMSSNPGSVELWVHGTSVKVELEPKLHCFISCIRYQLSVGASLNILQDKLNEITQCNC